MDRAPLPHSARPSRRAAGGFALALIALAAAPGCDEAASYARAYRATSPDQLIGGDLAMAQVGDFIIENDKIRVAILDKESSPAPGVFGGTLVDADIQRPQGQFRGGRGGDQLAELFPVANLFFPRPDTGDIVIVSDGGDGGAAIVRVSGDAGLFLEALGILKDPLVAALFPGVKVDLRFQTDYILEPGKPYVRMASTVTWTSAPTQSATALAMPVLTEATSIFGVLLGDAAAGKQPGILAGDFVFFGGNNDIFAPGIGFDEEKPVFDALYANRDTFTAPLAFDFMAAAGGNVSYGYFNGPPEGGGVPQVLVPLITSSSTGFVTHAVSCSVDSDDDAACDNFTSFTWERYFAVGAGDIASVADIVQAARGVAVGTLSGVVLNHGGGALPNARVFVLRDPDPTRTFADVAAVIDQNLRDVGTAGVLDAIDADVGLDPVEDGDFKATLPPGDYIVVAQNPAQTSTSPPLHVTIAVGEEVVISPRVPLPGRVRFKVTDGQGQAIEAKLTFTPVLADGTLADRDGLRQPALGQGRLGNGQRYRVSSLTGTGVAEVEPGTYRVVASHGPEFGIVDTRVSVSAGAEVLVTGVIPREVDTAGFIAGDFHLHSQPSFDSGLPFEERVAAAVVEGVELAVATDHDVVTDYGPTVHALKLEDRIRTTIGVELSTLEMGHFIAFPLAYDQLALPDHGAPDWTCKDGAGILAELQSKVEKGQRGVRIMAHPRDGFIGYISQLGISPWDFGRDLSLLEASNPLLAESSCDFDAMEVFNSKRLDLVRTPTNTEVILFNRCTGRIDAATTTGELDVACPELSEGGPLATCPASDRFVDCKDRHRRRMAFLAARRILERTPEEQAAFFDFVETDAAAAACDASRHTGDIAADIADEPCVEHIGTYDEWMRWLMAGLDVTITGASDSHGYDREPGSARTYVRSEAGKPGAIDVGAVAREVAAGHALPTYGPFIRAQVGAAEPGDLATVTGATFELAVNVQTASWFGVDRVEIYVNGVLERVITLDAGPLPIVDLDDTITLDTPARDGFVSVVALGTRDENLLRSVTLDVPFGELQLPRILGLAFGSLPVVSTLLKPTPAVPDFFPVFPMAATNAIRLDVDGDGQWLPSDGPPPLCARTCDPATPAAGACPRGETCLPTGVCGIPIDAECRTGPPGSSTR